MKALTIIGTFILVFLGLAISFGATMMIYATLRSIWDIPDELKKIRGVLEALLEERKTDNDKGGSDQEG